MTDKSTIWIGGGDGKTWYLVADLGLFHHKICEGQSMPQLEGIKEELQEKIACPLKIIDPKDSVSICLEHSGTPSGFSIRKGDSVYLSEVSFP